MTNFEASVVLMNRNDETMVFGSDGGCFIGSGFLYANWRGGSPGGEFWGAGFGRGRKSCAAR